jgi:hypothetical protein
MNRPRWSLGVVQHPWGPMVRIRNPYQKGYGQLSYGGISCSYVGHREDSHPMCNFFLELYMHRICTIIQLMTSFWPSIWGWKEVDLVILVYSSDQRLYQNVLRNRMSQSKIMVCGIQKCTHTHLKKILAVYSTMMFFLQEARITILEKRSTTTKT